MSTIYWYSDHENDSHQWLPAQLCHQCWPQWSDPCCTWGSHKGWLWWGTFLKMKKGEMFNTLFKMRISNQLDIMKQQILLTDQFGFVVCHHLVEDVVASLIRKLECHSRLLQQVCKDCLVVWGFPLSTLNRITWESQYLHVSISALASLPVVPKWILMNLPCLEQRNRWSPSTFVRNNKFLILK